MRPLVSAVIKMKDLSINFFAKEKNLEHVMLEMKLTYIKDDEQSAWYTDDAE